MSASGKGRILDLGADGSLKLPPDVLEALELEPGQKVRVHLDTRRKEIRVERHVDDPWGEALKKKQGPDFDDLFADQSRREAEAERLFRERMEQVKKEKPKRRPEDDPDYWR